MRKLFVILVAAIGIALYGCNNAGDEGSTKDSAADEKKTEQTSDAEEKDEITSGCCTETVASCGDIMTADKLLKSFESFKEGEEIEVCGKITHICQHGKKQMFLGTNTDDVVIVTAEEKFSEDLLGKKVVITGNFKIVEADYHEHDEDDDHIDDDQHKAAHDNTFIVEATKCQVCECDHKKE
ncbi:MAG: hypothetical protein ACOCVX_02405 [Bacteroidales bacterium]